MSIAADEVPELLGHPGRAGGVRAVVADRALVADDRRVADRAALRHVPFPLGARPPLDDRPDDLRDDVAGLLEDDVVADPDVLAAELVEVVEGRPGDGRSGDLDGGQVGHRRERAGPPDVGDDVLEDRLDLLRRELEGDRPARGAADHPEPLLLVEPVDLDDDAVGLVREVVALLAPRLGERDDALDVEAGLAVRVDREAERLQAIERRRLAGESRLPSPSSSISWYDQVLSWRLAVTAGSFWRSEPAPELRGFA